LVHRHDAWPFAERAPIGYADGMSKAKPTPVRLSELTPTQHADFFARLAEKTHRTTLSRLRIAVDSAKAVGL
jgi:hypothetical protein